MEKKEKKFGVFKTVGELNRAAAAQKAEGDLEALTVLAEENGLDREDAGDYMDGICESLCTPRMAAVGKLNLEAAELGLESQLEDWKDLVVQMVMEQETGELAEAVFDPGKKLLDVLAAGLKEASKNRVRVDMRILKAAGLPEGAAQIGMCGRDRLKKIVRDYYLGGQDEGIQGDGQ